MTNVTIEVISKNCNAEVYNWVYTKLNHNYALHVYILYKDSKEMKVIVDMDTYLM